MKKPLKVILCLACTGALLLQAFFGAPLFCYFSGQASVSATIGTGSVAVNIENLAAEDSGFTDYSEPDIPLPPEESDNNLMLNTLKAFSFTVKNTGISAVSYRLDIEIVWEAALSESSKLLLYPSGISDDTILENAGIGDFSGAIIGAEAVDTKQITTQNGVFYGISETVDAASLESLVTGQLSQTEKSYSFKLFFYKDAEINQSPAAFNGIPLQINIALSAELNDRQSEWRHETSKYLRFVTITDITPPVITPVDAPKTFFITQAGGIDLKAYATAFDDMDGDVTDSIVISSSPEFTPGTAGEYTITYNVSDRSGNAATPLQITIVIWDFVKITSGYYHTLALTSHGRVYVWGYNAYGQLGDGTTANRSTPKLLEGLYDIVDVAAGVGCSYALDKSGQIYAWGRNDNGRLGDGTTTLRTSPVMVKQPQGVTFVQVSGNFSTGGAVTAEGDVYTWGYGGYGAAGTGAIADNYTPTKINLSNIVQLEMGDYNGAAVTADGVLYTWGDNLHGQLGNGAPMAVGTNAPAAVPYFTGQNIRLQSVSVGYYHMAAVTDDGRLFTWGYGYEGRLGNNSISDRNTPQEITSMQNVQKALAGYSHTGILTDDGRVYFCGQNIYGKFGVGNTANASIPVLLSTINGISDFSLGYDSSFTLVDNRTVYGMGYGGTGVLGTGNDNSSTTPAIWAFTPPAPS